MELRKQVDPDVGHMYIEECVDYCFESLPDEPPEAISFTPLMHTDNVWHGRCFCLGVLKLVADWNPKGPDWKCAVNTNIYDTSEQTEAKFYEVKGKVFSKKEMIENILY